MARMLQHECDHLDGHIYLDRLEKDVRAKALKEFRDNISIK